MAKPERKPRVKQLTSEELEEIRVLLSAGRGTRFVVKGVKNLMLWLAAVSSGIIAIKYFYGMWGPR